MPIGLILAFTPLKNRPRTPMGNPAIGGLRKGRPMTRSMAMEPSIFDPSDAKKIAF